MMHLQMAAAMHALGLLLISTTSVNLAWGKRVRASSQAYPSVRKHPSATLHRSMDAMMKISTLHRSIKCDSASDPSATLHRSMDAMPLDRLLHQTSFTTRAEAREAILQGRVTLCGSVLTQNLLLPDPTASLHELRLDGERLSPPAPNVYLAMHKPRGVICTHSADSDIKYTTLRQMLLSPGVTALADLQRVTGVGRLDADSEGLLILTNDNTLATLLLQPGACAKTYVVALSPFRRHRHITSSEVDAIWADAESACQAGVLLRNNVSARSERCVRLSAAAAEQEAGRLCEGFGSAGQVYAKLEMRTGQRRVVRRMMKAVRFRTQRLCRTAIGSLTLDSLSLPAGGVAVLPMQVVADLYDGCHMSNEYSRMPAFDDKANCWVAASQMAAILRKRKEEPARTAMCEFGQSKCEIRSS
mmetsp:Transcript_15249/g.25087  ORF Transcript_15249/g.25087 Transcript_15249/m.25087 type:complete len:416 (+) Transcript_15249:49-1296(+)